MPTGQPRSFWDFVRNLGAPIFASVSFSDVTKERSNFAVHNGHLRSALPGRSAKLQPLTALVQSHTDDWQHRGEAQHSQECGPGFGCRCC